MGSTKPSRWEQKEATAAAVLDAARAEFEEHGFDGANLRSIAERAGVSAGTVIHHHGDKRELLYAALFDDLEATLQQALANPGPAPLARQLSMLGHAVFAYYQRRPKLSRTLLKESLFAEGPWQQKYTEQVQRTHVTIAGWVKEAAARGEVVGADANVVAACWFSFFYFALIGFVQGAAPAPMALVDALMAAHLAGLAPRQQQQQQQSTGGAT